MDKKLMKTLEETALIIRDYINGLGDEFVIMTGVSEEYNQIYIYLKKKPDIDLPQCLYGNSLIYSVIGKIKLL